ncbi:hypothetical protein ACJ6WE_08950 [Streptomyces sp. MMS24-I31]|uniref:hypothetical protein n=1 Tax=Streptomyces sp. MMS24-I31 TaxID=3351563 RepID=UPI003896BFDF
MRVRVRKPFTAYWNYAITEFKEGAELEGEQARHFADNAPEGSVEILEADPEPAPAPKPSEPVQPEGDEPPVDGTIDDLMAWVDGDPDRAGRALEAEQAKDKPRSTVVKRLTALADSEE